MWKSVIWGTALAAFVTVGNTLAASDKSSGAAMEAADQKAEKPEEAVINFADLPHRIDSWRAEGDQTLYLKVGVNDWYKAELRGPCTGLQFTQSIALVTDGLNRVDKFSSVLVDAGGGSLHRCWFKSLTKVDGPPDQSSDEKPDSGG
jgi:hypothetical protein